MRNQIKKSVCNFSTIWKLNQSNEKQDEWPFLKWTALRQIMDWDEKKKKNKLVIWICVQKWKKKKKKKKYKELKIEEI